MQQEMKDAIISEGVVLSSIMIPLSYKKVLETVPRWVKILDAEIDRTRNRKGESV